MNHRSSATDETPSPDRPVLRYLALICQLLLLTKVVQVFHIEERHQFLQLMLVTVGGFIIYHRAADRYRLPIFLFVSLIGLVVILGITNAALLIGTGLVLIGVCHLPLSLVLRVVLLVIAAGVVAYARVLQPLPFWPIFGSIFMFRLAIYLREAATVSEPASWSHRLSYFFLLPNACFPLVPVVDYRLFLSSHRGADDQVAQRGITWIVRGIVHLVLYRYIKYHVLPPPDDIWNLGEALIFLAANYALYLHVSGTFHIFTGILHLFGFDLPRTHDSYFFAHSFTDIWRRINIYWKNALTEHIFLPAFFRLGRFSMPVRITLAIAVVFGCTWVLHSYQVFWLLGEFPLRWREGLLWLLAGVIVAVNAVWDYQAARKVKSRPGPLSLHRALRRSLQILGVFLTVSVFWACWTRPKLLAGLAQVASERPDFFAGVWQVLAVLTAGVAVGTVIQLVNDRMRSKPYGWLWKIDLETSPIPAVAVSACLLVMGQPAFQNLFRADASRILATLTSDYATTLELARSVPGYYEDLANANLQSDPLVGTGVPLKPPGQLLYSDITRPRNDVMELELIPRWKGELSGAQLSINRWGMRDGPIPRQKPEGTSRIAVVGSSVVMGFGVRDEEVFTELVEAQLNREFGQTRSRHYEMLNFGVGRYYALHIAAYLRETIYDFEPDAVYYVAHQGEFHGPVPHLAKCRFERLSLPYDCLDQILKDAGIDDETSWGSIQRILQPRGKEITSCIYKGIVADCRERGVLPVWIYLPMPGIIEVSQDTQELVDVAKEAGFHVIDLSHWADGKQPGEVKLNPGDHHANAVGHRIIADLLAERLKQNPELVP